MMQPRVAFPVLSLLLLAAACSSTSGPARPPSSRPSPNDPLAATTLMQQGQVLVNDGRVDEGIERYREALRLQPKNPTIYNLLGLAQLQKGAAVQALESFNHALALAPSYSDARNNRGTSYLKLGQLAMAEAEFIAVLGDRTYAHRSGVFFNLGSLYFAQGHLAAAEENLRKASIASGPVEALVMLGHVEERLGKIEAAEATWRKAIDRAPERTDVLLALARVLERQGRVKESLELYRRVVNLAPNSDEAKVARQALGS